MINSSKRVTIFVLAKIILAGLPPVHRPLFALDHVHAKLRRDKSRQSYGCVRNNILMVWIPGFLDVARDFPARVLWFDIVRVAAAQNVEKCSCIFWRTTMDSCRVSCLKQVFVGQSSSHIPLGPGHGLLYGPYIVP